jgi:hypothetical protein
MPSLGASIRWVYPLIAAFVLVSVGSAAYSQGNCCGCGAPNCTNGACTYHWQCGGSNYCNLLPSPHGCGGSNCRQGRGTLCQSTICPRGSNAPCGGSNYCKVLASGCHADHCPCPSICPGYAKPCGANVGCGCKSSTTACHKCGSLCSLAATPCNNPTYCVDPAHFGCAYNNSGNCGGAAITCYGGCCWRTAPASVCPGPCCCIKPQCVIYFGTYTTVCSGVMCGCQ